MTAVDIAFTCYPVTSLKKAQEFYEGVLELTPTNVWVKDDTSGMIEYDIGPATLAIGAGSDQFKLGSGGGTVAIEVDDFDKTVEQLKKKGQKFVMEPYESPVCNMAIVSDPDNNKVVIHRRKPKNPYSI